MVKQRIGERVKVIECMWEGTVSNKKYIVKSAGEKKRKDKKV